MEGYNIISWNIRGASKEANRSNVKTVVNEVKGNLLCLQETKSQNWPICKVHNLGLCNNVGWVESVAQGRSGGLLLVWEKDYFEVKETVVHRSWIAVKGILSKTGAQFVCINVYAPQKSRDKSMLWDVL